MRKGSPFRDAAIRLRGYASASRHSLEDYEWARKAIGLFRKGCGRAAGGDPAANDPGILKVVRVRSSNSHQPALQFLTRTQLPHNRDLFVLLGSDDAAVDNCADENRGRFPVRLTWEALSTTADERPARGQRHQDETGSNKWPSH